MHSVGIRQEIIDRVMARRGRLHWFDQLEPARTALVTVDMQSTFCAPDGPAEVPASRGIVPNINRLTAGLRRLKCPTEVRRRTIESLEPGRQHVWPELETAADDMVLIKNRYSALVPGSSPLERVLRNLGIDTIPRARSIPAMVRADPQYSSPGKGTPCRRSPAWRTAPITC
jgi:ureidoacrylate peracid hydrolase